MAVHKRLSAVILWSVISAAFIGPGTVTTAASAGANFQLGLLWAVLFSTVACLVLQELSARLAIVTGLPMGQAIIKKYGEARGRWLNFFLGGPVILGCIAYEAGNIVGAVSGLQLLTGGAAVILTIIVTLGVVIVLWTNRKLAIGWIMTALVGIMGIAFVTLASDRPFSLADYAQASFVPRIPAGAELLTLALVGTTIVPYNVFLGSGVSKGQTLPLMRTGLSISVAIGGVITAAILIAGTAVAPFESFPELYRAMQETLGPLGALALGVGLFAAGFSSSITSPYAASVIASSVFGWGKNTQRGVWTVVVLTGFVVGVSGAKPIPVILLVQALNGMVLPLLTAYLILLINDVGIVQRDFQPSPLYNVVLAMIFASILFMGLHSIAKSLASWFNLTGTYFSSIVGITVIFTGALVWRVLKLRAG